MALFAVAGSRIFIGRRVARPSRDLVAADFAGAPWVEIDGWTTVGALGDTQELITQNVIAGGRTRKAKGTRNGARFENTFMPMPRDPGQLRFQAAVESCAAYEFKVEWNAGCDDDAPEQTDLFYGLAFPGARAGGEANSSQLRSWAIEPVSNIVEQIGEAIPLGAILNSQGGYVLNSSGGYVLGSVN